MTSRSYPGNPNDVTSSPKKQKSTWPRPGSDLKGIIAQNSAIIAFIIITYVLRVRIPYHAVRNDV